VLAQQFRLKQERNFELLFQEGDYVSGKVVSLKYCKISESSKIKSRFDLNDLRIGFIVSTDVDKRATIRNRKKRQMREAVRQLIKQDKIKLGYVMAFIANTSIADADYQKIEYNIIQVLKKANLLNDNRVN
jgi:ribonuclease P protein component